MHVCLHAIVHICAPKIMSLHLHTRMIACAYMYACVRTFVLCVYAPECVRERAGNRKVSDRTAILQTNSSQTTMLRVEIPGTLRVCLGTSTF